MHGLCQSVCPTAALHEFVHAFLMRSMRECDGGDTEFAEIIKQCIADLNVTAAPDAVDEDMRGGRGEGVERPQGWRGEGAEHGDGCGLAGRDGDAITTFTTNSTFTSTISTTFTTVTSFTSISMMTTIARLTAMTTVTAITMLTTVATSCHLQ